MAIDTKAKRYSMLNSILPVITVPSIVADGTIDQGDRQHLLGFYSGLLFPTLVPSTALTITLITPMTPAITLTTPAGAEITLTTPMTHTITLITPVES